MTKDLMSKGSRKILGSKSVNRSRSQTSFLQRNYYGAREKSQSRLSAMERDRSASRTRDNSVSHNYLRDMSGNKISFINSTSAATRGKKTYDSGGNELFKPAINGVSRMMSPRDKETTFYMLH